MFIFDNRTQETTNSVCLPVQKYTKFSTLAEATAALLDVPHNEYAKVTMPKENLCIFFGPFQSVRCKKLRIVLCGGSTHNLLEPTKFFRLVVGPPSRKGYIGQNWSYYLQHLNTMGVLGEYLFEEITDSAVETVGHEGGDTITGNEVIPDTSFHLRSIFWDEKTIGFTFLILGKFINLLVFFCYYNFVLFHIV